MASKKKASEGIALLSMYGEEDDEMEDLDEEEKELHEEDIPTPASDGVAQKDNVEVNKYGNEIMPPQLEERGLNDNSTPNKTFNYGNSSASATPQLSILSPQQPQQQQPVGSDLSVFQSQNNRLTIVEYGHEEGAMSPEAAEEGEFLAAAGRVMYGEQLLTSDGESQEKRSLGIARFPAPSTQVTPSRSLELIEQPELRDMHDTAKESQHPETEDNVMLSVEEQTEVDPFDKFLPSPPKTKCSEELQERIIKFLALKKTTGRSFNSEVRNRKEYRNPDFLLHAVTYQDIDQIGSCLSKDVFDPHGYGKSDFYDEIEADMKREMERREQERKKNQKLEFAPGVIQPGNVVPTQKIYIPTPGPAVVASGVVNVTQTTSDIISRDSRQNKKSKWDKVDVDQRNSLSAGGHENLPGVGAHAAVLSAAKVGSGYSAFAQQKRREAEDKRSSDKKFDRRS